jgi:hypothetical protein
MQSFTAQLVSPPPRGIRRSERHRVRTPAQCRRGTLRETLEILDLSIGGARVLAIAPLRVGFSIWIKLPGIEAQEARVAWTRGYESGCEFVRLLHPAVLQLLLSPRILA